LSKDIFKKTLVLLLEKSKSSDSIGLQRALPLAGNHPNFLGEQVMGTMELLQFL
jgi:hypothetical protein